MILVEGFIENGDLALAEGVIKGLVDLLRGYPQT
jgi:hypothetical protein